MATLDYTLDMRNRENVPFQGSFSALQEAIYLLSENNTRIAIASIGCFALITPYLAGVANNFNKVFMTKNIGCIKSKSLTLRERLINAAEVAAEFNGADYGIAISEVYQDIDSDDFYCIASITNFDDAIFITVKADLNTKPYDIIIYVVNAVMETIKRLTDDKIAEKERKRINRRIIPLKVAIICCGTGIVVCITRLISLL